METSFQDRGDWAELLTSTPHPLVEAGQVAIGECGGIAKMLISLTEIWTLRTGPENNWKGTAFRATEKELWRARAEEWRRIQFLFPSEKKLNQPML